MKSQSIVIVLIIIGVVVFFVWNRFKNLIVQPNTKRPSENNLPKQEKQNDKLIIIKDVNQNDLRNVIIGFCNAYNRDKFQILPRLSKLNEQEFAIIFPYNIVFEIFCYFINYLEYPVEVKWNADVLAWNTLANTDKWTTEKTVNKKVMLFIPSDDTEYDNVYLTTFDTIGYKLGFASGEEKQLLKEVKKLYTNPPIDMTTLINLPFEDYK